MQSSHKEKILVTDLFSQLPFVNLHDKKKNPAQLLSSENLHKIK